MKSSPKSARPIALGILLTVVILLPLAITKWTGASSIPAFGTQPRSVAFDPLAEPGPVPFAAFTVNSLADTGAGSGTSGTLRYCITQANAMGGSNTITFSVTGTITLTSALPFINTNTTITIDGPGASLLTISGNNAVRIFQTSGTPGASVSNLTIANGKAPTSGPFGGGIYHTGSGILNITNCVVRNCSALIGGGIFNEASGTINIVDCAVRNNSTSGSNGGGLFNNLAGIINVSGSTFNNNSVGTGSGGGGIYNNSNGSQIILKNSTFSLNNGGGGAGLQSVGGTVTVTNCTFTNNVASAFGGGIARTSGTIQIKNSIVAQNSAPAGPDVSGAFTSLGYNLIGDNAGATGFTAGLPNPGNDYVGTGGSPVNAQLLALADNGGPTQTHALSSTSLAIDHGSAAAGVTTDQRGSQRPFDNLSISPSTGGDNSDIGAFEAGNFVFVGGNTTYTPAAAPVGAVRMNVSTSTNFKGKLVGSPTTGVVRITNAHPAGTYLVTVKAFDSGGIVTTSAFNLTVTTPSPSCGAASFTNAPDVPTSINACSMAVGDFNNDGKQDLAVATNTGDSVSIRFGNGTGGFTGSLNVPVGPASHPGHGIQPNEVAIGDFNGDGNQDFATANLHTGTVSIRLGNGAGGFTGETATSEITTGGNSDAQQLAIGDFNGDGKQDLVVSNPQSSTYSILIGDGLGAFSILSTTSLFSPKGAAVGDFNSDGKQDLAIASFDSIAIRLGNGLGGFSGSTSINVGNRPQSVAIGDFNNDGKQDFVSANPGASLGNATASVRFGDGLGAFSGSTTVTVGIGNYWVAVGDFNNDGKQDFVTANYSGNSASVRLGDGAGAFGNPTDVSVGGHPISVAIGDFNADTNLDFATANVSTNNASIRLGVCTPAVVNTAPTITAQAGVTRQQGSPASNSQIATVGDAETGAASVTVTVTTANPSNGVTISNIVNTAGTVTADIVASCTATNATFTLQASDGSLTSTATLSVTVTANTPPTLTYANQSVAFAGSTTVSPSAALDNGSIASYTLQSVVPALTTTPTLNAVGVLSVTNAQPLGNHVITIRATDNCGATTDAAFTLTVNNASPTITAAGPLSRQRSSAAINSQIATVSDANQAANTLSVTATPVTGTGVSVTGISVAASGNVTADVVASCTATNSTFTLTVTDSQSATATATLTVNVTANTPPTLTYSSPQSVAFNGSLNVTPSAASDNGTITGYSVQSVVPALTTAPTVNASGVVAITNAQPSGNHVITIRATDNCGATTDSSFTLNVGSSPPSIAATPVSRQQGNAASNSQIATVTDADDPLASLAVTVNSSSSATTNGVTVSNLTVDPSGVVKADVGASCGATNASFTLKVTDSAGSMNTATLNVTVTANPAPTLGSYGNSSLSLGAGVTVTPASAPTDNGSITGMSVTAFGFTGTFLVNAGTGAVTIAGAGPVGTFTVIVTASDNCGASSTKMFLLTVSGTRCGNIALGSATSFTAGNIPIHVAVGDFNLDGKSDLAVSNLTSNDVTILLNNGSGGFTQPPGSPLGPMPTAESVAVGDINLDGKPDLAVLNGGASRVTIMLGNGLGGFAQAAGSPVDTGVASFPFALAFGDFNHDGKPDIATANGNTNNVTILLGDGSGGLAPAAGSPFAVGARPRSIAVGDFNLDTHPDIATANETSGNTSILLGNGSGGFVPAAGSPLATGAGSRSVTVGDFNLDNNLDLAVASQFSSQVSIQLGNGSGGFTQPAGSPITSGVFGAFVVSVADFDVDGKPDLSVQTAITGETAILRGNGAGGFTVQNVTIGVNPQFVAIGDFNLDGKPDLATANFPSNNVTTLLNVCIPNEPPTISAAGPLSRARGNGATTSQIATVSDGDQAANTLSVTVNGGASATVNGVTVNGIAIDAGGNVTASVEASCVATNATFTLTVTDTMGATATTTLTVNVTPDSQPPVIVGCPTNITQSNDPNLCSAVVSYTPPTATDNCGSAPVVCVPPAGSTFPKGTTSVNCTATDGAGNSSTCTFSVNVNDTQAPSISCPASIVQANDPGQCAAVVTFANATATDNCSGVGVPTCVPASGSTFPKGLTSVTCTVSDASENSSSCSFTVTINDTQSPVITCPANITKPNDPGLCAAVVSYANAMATDNCSGVGTPTCVPASGSSFPKGLTTVTCNVSDASGNNASCSFSVTVNDTQAPTIACPANITKPNDPGQCSALVSYATPTASDNCSGVGTVTCSPASGSTFVKGTTTVTCSATDASGNNGSCSFSVIVNDTQAPAITCPANITKANDPGQCAAVVTYTNASATDNCSGVGTPTCSPASGSTFPKGVTSVTCNVSDASGNSNSCTFAVTVNDTQAPTLTCPLNITKPNDPGQCSAVATYATPAAYDNCSGVGVVTCVPASGSTFGKGTTTVTCSVTDASGNNSSCGFTVTVNDAQAPTITCPANITKSNDPGQCAAIVTYVNATATDNCSGLGAPICSPASGSSFPQGVTTVTCSVTDASANSTSCVFTVTVNDTQAPTMTCPSNVTRANDPGQCSAVVTYATPSANDNCPGAAVVTCSPASGSTFPKGITSVTCTATDPGGNSSSCTFTVTVNDTQAPTITCPANITKATDPNLCGAAVSYATPSASDNCTGVGKVTCSPSSGSTFTKGTTTVTCSATDASGNQGACTFTVTVNDTQSPSIVCPANITKAADPNQCSALVTYPAPTVSDNCPGAGAPTCSPLSGTSFQKGTTTVTCTVKDASNNQSSCSFTVTVNDTQLPVITCPANQTRTLVNPTDTTVPVTYPSPVVSDNCPGAAFVCSPPSGSAFPAGVTTVTCTATDTSGNQSSCTFTVTTFNVCLQDDSNPGTVILFNSTTGDYVFCCSGTTYVGTGTIVKQGSIYTLTHNMATRRVLARLDLTQDKGTASLQAPAGVMKCSLSDRDIHNNSCVCGGSGT